MKLDLQIAKALDHLCIQQMLQKIVLGALDVDFAQRNPREFGFFEKGDGVAQLDLHDLSGLFPMAGRIALQSESCRAGSIRQTNRMNVNARIAAKAA